MKKISLLLCLLFVLSACASPYDSDGAVSVSEPDHSHPAPESGNVVAHEPEGYCGNTVTTVRCIPMGKAGNGWERSFWGGSSVGLSDFLRWLDYSGEVCRCLPEYYVKTEFAASEYGINLSDGYVRFEGGQCQLTQEQTEWLKSAIDEIEKGGGKDLCALPPAEKRPVYQ